VNKLLQRIVLYFSIIVLGNFTQGQNQNGEQPLSQILLTLEKRYDIKFSFESKVIANITTNPLDSELTLKQAITQLGDVTPLNFKVLSERFIAITPKTQAELNNTIQALEEVVVINYLTKGISKINSGSIEIDTKGFSILPGLIEPDVLQIVQNLPGIISVDERISNLNVRGGTNDQNLILYEGIRMYQSGHFFGLISAFNPYLTQNVTISKNGTSAKFGDAVSSSILIENGDVVDQEFNAGIGGNLISVDGFAKIPTSKKTELQLSMRRSITDLIASTTYDSYFDRIFRDSELNTTNNGNTLLALDERFLFYDFNAKFLYDINPSSKLRVNVLNMYNNLDYNSVFATAQNTFQETRSNLSQANFGASTSYTKVLKNGINTSAEVYYSNYDLLASNNDLENEQELTQENKVEDYGLRLDISKLGKDGVKYSGGYQFNEVGVTNFEDVSNPNFTSLAKEIIRTHALFGEAEWYSKSRKTYIRIGSRINYFEKLSELLIEPRFAINYKFLDHFRLEILGELKSQSITQVVDLQQDFFGIEKRRWQLANGNDIPLIKSEQLSAGITYNHNNLLVSIEGYYKGVNHITTRSQGFQNQFQFTNATGLFIVKGVDFLINKRFRDFSAWLSYSYSKNDYNFETLNNGNDFPNTVDLRHIANASLTYNLDNFKVGLGLNWHSGRPFTATSNFQNDNNSSIEYLSANGSRLPPYFRTDISAIYKVRLSKGVKGEIGASIWNLFNQTNIINRFYTLDSEGHPRETNNRALKFTPNLSFRINF
jgi:hypothetical protein